jgi:hypothetical protein
VLVSRSKCLTIAIAIVVASAAYGTSARPIYPQLVGIHEVSLNISLPVFPGMDSEALERAVRERLHVAGLEIEEVSEPSLFIHAEYGEIPGCGDLVSLRTEVAVSEEVELRRPGKNPKVWVDIYSSDEEFTVSKSEAWETAHDSLLGLLDTLLKSRQYTAETMKKYRK